jgi:hypothetical protein
MRFLHASRRLMVPAALLLALFSAPEPSGAELTPPGAASEAKWVAF